MNHIEVTSFWYNAIKNTGTEENFCDDEQMENGIYKRLRNLTMPNFTIKAVLKQGLKGLDEVHKQAPYYDFTTYSAKGSMQLILDKYSEDKESLYDVIKNEMNRYGSVGVADIINRRCVYRVMEFILENDKEWIKQWGTEKAPAEKTPAVKDNVNHPTHYASQGEIECIDYISAVVTPYQGVVAGDLQNVLKYTWRCHHKNGVEDLKKAQWYANHAIKKIQEQMQDTNSDRYKMAMYAISNYKQTQAEHDLILKAAKQVEKGLKPIEASKYELVLATIMNGDLYKDIRTHKALTTALNDWVQEFERTNVKSSLKSSFINNNKDIDKSR